MRYRPNGRFSTGLPRPAESTAAEPLVGRAAAAAAGAARADSTGDPTRRRPRPRLVRCSASMSTRTTGSAREPGESGLPRRHAWSTYRSATVRAAARHATTDRAPIADVDGRLEAILAPCAATSCWYARTVWSPPCSPPTAPTRSPTSPRARSRPPPTGDDPPTLRTTDRQGTPDAARHRRHDQTTTPAARRRATTTCCCRTATSATCCSHGHDWRSRGRRRTVERIPLGRAPARPWVPHPNKIVCLGLNYATHIAEMGRPTPEHPTLFAKFDGALIGAHDDYHSTGQRPARLGGRTRGRHRRPGRHIGAGRGPGTRRRLHGRQRRHRPRLAAPHPRVPLRQDLRGHHTGRPAPRHTRRSARGRARVWRSRCSVDGTTCRSPTPATCSSRRRHHRVHQHDHHPAARRPDRHGHSGRGRGGARPAGVPAPRAGTRHHHRGHRRTAQQVPPEAAR